jgi:hypothetical protein
MFPAKNGIFEPFIYKNEHFAKTGSGQTQGNTQKKMPFSAPGACTTTGRPEAVS